MQKIGLIIGVFLTLTLGGMAFVVYENSKQGIGVSLTNAEQEFIDQHPEITLAGALSFEPFLIQNLHNNISGYDVDVMALVSKKTGLKISFELGIWAEIQEKADSRSLDGLSTATYDEKRAINYNKTIPYFYLSEYAFVSADNPENIHNIKDLEGKRLALQKGNLLSEAILNRAIADLELSYYDTIHEVINSVAMGSADVMISAESTPYIIQKLGLSHSVEMAFQVGEPTELVFLIRNDWPELVPIINKAIKSISEKELEEIKERWFMPIAKRVNNQLFIYVISILIVLLSTIVIRAYALYREKKTSDTLLKSSKEKIEALALKNTKLNQLSITDPLTGLYNRAEIDLVLDRELDRSERYQATFGIIFIDIDFFKSVNDTFGHQTGDSVLKSTATILKRCLREVDTIGRWGGEEFLIICPETDRNGVESLAEKIRQNIAQYDFSLGEAKTASFGVTVYQNGDDRSSIISRTDTALYKAKKTGRNKVVFL